MTSKPSNNEGGELQDGALHVNEEASGWPVEEASVAKVSPNANVTIIQDPDDPDMVIVRTRKRRKKKHSSSGPKLSRRARIAIIVVAVIVGVLAAVGIALAIAVNMGNVNLHKVFGGLENTPEIVEVQDEGQIVEYKGHKYRYNENIVSFLLIGHDDEGTLALREGASCADINVLVTLDTSNNKMHAVVVPRNSWVPVDLYDENSNYVGTRDLQLTLSHAVLLNTMAECAENTTKSVARIFYNLPIEYYVDIDQQVVKEASRAVGGVQVEALEAIPGQSYQVGDTVLLEGESAYRYVQYRNVDVVESVLDRQARQIQFVKAFMGKVKDLGVQGILNLYNSVSDDVTTNIGATEIAYLASCFVAGGNSEMEISTITGTTDIQPDSNGVDYERYYLDDESVMENTLAAFYTQID